MYGIYVEFQRVYKTPRFNVLPSGALECRDTDNYVTKVFAPGSWDRVSTMAEGTGAETK